MFGLTANEIEPAHANGRERMIAPKLQQLRP
ncbi:hypothetical protein BSS2_I1303 [Brucella suis bv. 1 str. S2]|uniref:Uncharacterized protein n=3 Tax=Brucella TaxID=234 RepID=Q2YQE4_BRUA2|nr:hypothetical protein BR1341 [Brucella suis 1330]AAX74671.1 hypothetical protein BruAb1_1339 [Brucella abortus bv. 1 str. 9-941]AEU06340.1 hypothetical protein BSVBI22_A1336 [Brucella suis VBI22]AHN46958.1 hypothetical protein BSS2_I1303 [Brucella suis bv. 1 str. S2]CAJ11317.1 conserved hypothetical protein [Brucella abortus 2308]CDL76728.1 unnamed protein product [Brucella canis str. Oliveri]SHO31128.1 predicted protein [Brucella abortus]